MPPEASRLEIVRYHNCGSWPLRVAASKQKEHAIGNSCFVCSGGPIAEDEKSSATSSTAWTGGAGDDLLGWKYLELGSKTTRIFVLMGTAYLGRSLYILVSPAWGSRAASTVAGELFLPFSLTAL